MREKIQCGENMNSEHIVRIVENHTKEGEGVISILEDIQAQYGYLPADALRIISEKMGSSLVDLYGVATFYKSFSLKPRGKHLVSVCLGTACHVRGAQAVAEELKRLLGISAGETTSDNEFTLETVNCLGACALGPIVVVDGHYFSNVDPTKVKSILHRARVGLEEVEVSEDASIFPLEVNCPHCNHSLMDAYQHIDGHLSIRIIISFGNRHGWLWISCLYGSYNFKSEWEIPVDTIVNFFCPYCHAELVGASNCVECGAPMVPMIVRKGGMMRICSRRGCKNHMLDLSSINF